jgi:hypothetical protein
MSIDIRLIKAFEDYKTMRKATSMNNRIEKGQAIIELLKGNIDSTFYSQNINKCSNI